MSAPAGPDERPLSAEALAALADPLHAAAVLAAIGAARGDPRYLCAAGHLRGSIHSGRPGIDDSDALRQMRDLLDSDDLLSVAAAANFVARTLRGNHSAEATAVRLARKYRRNSVEH